MAPLTFCRFLVRLRDSVLVVEHCSSSFVFDESAMRRKLAAGLTVGYPAARQLI